MTDAGSADFSAFRLGDIDVEPHRNLVRNNERDFALEPRIMDVLCLLVRHSGDVVARDTLIDEIWQIEHGGEDSLTRAISLLRKTFREAGVTNEVIETIPKRGYRLAVPVAPLMRPPKSIPPLSEPISVSGAAFVSAPPDTEAQHTSTAPASHWWRKRRAILVGVIIAAASLAFLIWPRQTPPTEQITVSTKVETPPRSLAVLPFADLSPAGDQGYFSDGISEEILNAMSNIDGLMVAGRTSSFAFRDKDADLREIGATLNVAYVLEGSVRKQDDELGISVRLIEAESGYKVWSEQYDRDLDDIFSVQDEIARAVASELNLLLDDPTDEPLAKILTTNGEAHDLLLRARAAYRKSPDAETFNKAEAMIKQAVTLDPNFADAWIALATLNNFAAGYDGARSPQLAFENARAAIAKAAEIEPDDAHLIIWQANIKYFEGDLAEAYRLAQQAVALEPENEGIVFSIGHYNAIFGYTDRAVPLIERATRLDPLDSFAWHTKALISQNQGDFAKAEAEAKRAVELGDLTAMNTLSWNAFAEGDATLAMKIHMALFEKMGAQMDQGLGARMLWQGIGRAIFQKSEDDAAMIRPLLRLQFSSPEFEPGAVSINTVAKMRMYDEMYDQWRGSYTGKSTLAISIWSDFEWARALRQDDGFKSFLDREGFIQLWQTYGWPEICQPDAGTDGSNGQFSCD